MNFMDTLGMVCAVVTCVSMSILMLALAFVLVWGEVTRRRGGW